MATTDHWHWCGGDVRHSAHEWSHKEPACWNSLSSARAPEMSCPACTLDSGDIIGAEEESCGQRRSRKRFRPSKLRTSD